MAGTSPGVAPGSVNLPATGGGAEMDPSRAMAAEGGIVNGPKSKVGQYFHGQASQTPLTTVAMAKGGAVPALVSPGEQYLPPQAVEQVKKGANPLSVGERIPGTPKYKGNNYANDIVPKTLETGGIVVPNKVMQSKDRDAKARAFVEAVLAKKGKK